MDDKDFEDLLSIVSRLARVGIVTDVDKKKRKARVKFDDEDLPSGWLRILANPPFIPKVDEPQRTEYEAGGGGDEAFASHKHDVIITPWLPRVNDVVLTLFLPCHDSDGYILGRIEEDTNLV